ncbi:unnamed protein product [Rotaria sp. Silwood1]|nr:unnamed protein product [Rotaria sp. Silwood1]CAF3616175.1 unnamed protein product [Rotaria sp. Silwood1]
MTNGYNTTSTKSRSFENNLDLCGQKISDELTISSSSLIDLPTSSSTISHTDYDNLPIVDNENEINEEKLIIHQTITRLSTQIQSPISSELDQKIKDEIDARLKDIDDEFDFKLPVTAETVNKSVDLPSAQRLAKRLYALDGFKSIDVVRHLCKSIRNSSQLPGYNHRTRYLFDISYYTELTNVERRSNKTRYR